MVWCRLKSAIVCSTLTYCIRCSRVQYSTVYFRLGLRLGVEYPQYIDLDEGRPTVYAALEYSTVQYGTVQYSTVQYSTVQYSTVQYSTVQYSTVQYSTVQYSTVFFRLGLRLGVENLQYIDLDEGRPTLYAALEYSTVQCTLG